MVRRHLAVRLAAASVVFHAAPSFAQESEDAARKAFAAAQVAEQNGDARAACDHYRSSLASLRAPGILERVARCDALDGRYVVAIAKIDEALGMLTPDNTEDQKAYQALHATWKSKLARLVVKAESSAVAAALTIDGKATATGPGPLELDPGDHTVGDGKTSRTITLASGDNPPLELPLVAIETAPPPKPQRPETPVASSGLSGWQTAALVSFGVGVAAFAGAAVTGVIALDQDSTAEETCASSSNAACRAAIDDAKSLLAPNLALWIVGGVAAGAGVTFLVVDASGPSAPSAAEALRVRVGPTSLAVTKRF